MPKFQCDKCDRSFPSKQALGVHYSKIHGLNWTETHSPARLFACDLCDRKYATANGLNQHRFKTHDLPWPSLKPKPKPKTLPKPLPDLPFKCDLCDRSFATLNGLSIHYSYAHKLNYTKTHPKPKPFQCPECEKNYNTQRGLDMHLTREHHYPTKTPLQIIKEAEIRYRKARPMEFPVKCPYCEFRSKSKRGVNLHISKSHPGEKLLPNLIANWQPSSQRKALLKIADELKKQSDENIVRFYEEELRAIVRGKTSSDSLTSSEKLKLGRLGLIYYKASYKNREMILTEKCLAILRSLQAERAANIRWGFRDAMIDLFKPKVFCADCSSILIDGGIFAKDWFKCNETGEYLCERCLNLRKSAAHENLREDRIRDPLFPWNYPE